MSGPRYSPVSFRALQPTTGGDTTSFFKVQDADGGTPVFSVDTSNERVGIGTTAASPKNTLQVNHSAADGDNGVMIVNEATTVADAALLGGIGFDSKDGNVPSSVLESSAYIAAYAAEAQSATDKGGDLAFGTSAIDDDDDTTSNERMRILDSGHVGIGTSAPGGRLTVQSSLGKLPGTYSTPTFAESLAQGSFTDGSTNLWALTGFQPAGGPSFNTDFAFVTSPADSLKFDYSNGGYSYVTQMVSSFTPTAALANTWYKFTYTVSGVADTSGGESGNFAMLTDDDPSNCGGACNGFVPDGASYQLTLSDGTHSLYFKSTTSTGSKKFQIFTGGGSDGTYFFDDFSLSSPDVVACSTSHGLSTGNIVVLPSGAGGAPETRVVTQVLDSTTFVVDTALSNTISSATCYQDDWAEPVTKIQDSVGTMIQQVDSGPNVILAGNNLVTRATVTSAADGLVAVGVGAAASNTSGEKNTAIGAYSLLSEDDGDENTAIGYNALKSQAGTSGQVGNTAVGTSAGANVTTGTDNVFVGRSAGSTATTITNSVGIGALALGGTGAKTSTAVQSTAVGHSALAAITNGERNTAIGHSALSACVDGDMNTAVGSGVLSRCNPSGGSGENTAIGNNAGGYLTTGTANTFIGSSAGQGKTDGSAPTTGASNTAVGRNAGYLLQGAAHSNTLIGADAGDLITTGTNNVCIGKGTDPSAAGGTNQIVIGVSAAGHGDNIAVIGDANITAIHPADDNGVSLGSGTYSFDQIYLDGSTLGTSDRRVKENITTLSLGLEFINKLNPVSFKKKDKEEVYDGDRMIQRAITHKRKHTGFIAQEIKQVMDDMNISTNDFGGYVDANIKEGVDKLFLRYEEFIAPIVKAVQELSAKVAELESKLENQ